MNKKLAQLLAENPDLPVKVHISGELRYGPSEYEWCIGNLCGCELTEYVEHGCSGEYEECFYFGRDNENLWYYVRDEIWYERRTEIAASMPKLPVDSPVNAIFERYQKLGLAADAALPDALHDRLTRERIESLDWKPCILVRVGP